MAKLADLVVGIGLNTKQLNKDLGKARREFKRLGSNFKSLGRDLSRNVSLPLAALGAAAIKSATDLERLETSFISLTGGAEQAAKMMQQLNKFTAETPFQIEGVADAAKKLLASGTDISKVNDQLQFLGDIAATGGHRIEDLTAIFAKVNAKGKVELESLNQLAERGIPIFDALAEATGLLPSELGAGAVSVEQFNKTLASFAKEGGFAHGAMERLSKTASGQFSTALDALKLAGADLMKDVLPILTDLLQEITSLAKGFINLSDDTKKFILVAGSIATALGPVLVVLPQIVSSFELMGMAIAALGGPISLTVAAVAALGAGIVTLVNVYRDNSKEVDKYAETISKIESVVVSQTSKVRALINIYGDEKTSLNDRKKILEELNKIDKNHFKNLDAEKTTINDLTDSLKLYTEQLRKTAVQKQLEEESAKIFAELAENEIKLFDTKTKLEQENQRLLKAGIDVSKRKAGTVSIETDEYRSLNNQVSFYTKAVKESHDAVVEFRNRETQILNSFGVEHTNTTNTLIENNNKIGSSFDGLSQKVKLAGQEFELFESGQLLGFLNDFYDASITASEGVTAITEKLNELRDASGPAMQQATQNVEGFALESSSQLLDFLNDYQVTAQQTVDMTNSLSSGMETLGGMIAQTFQGLIDGSIEGKDALRTLAKQIIAAAVAQAISNAVANASSALNAENQISAGKTIGKHMIIALGSVAAGLAAMPAFAQGGIVYGPGMAMVGDNRNAGLDPEVIAPLSKLERIMGGRATQVFGRISGDDIVISNDRATRDRNRYE